MASQGSQIDCNVTIYFVILRKYESEDDTPDEMWNAYNKCCEYDLEPEWITEDECYGITSDKSIICVMEEFEGDVFEKLRSSKCLVIGPKCLLICFNNGEPIPDRTNPVYTTALKDVCVCVSGLSKDEKERVQRLVEFMGGVFMKQLRTCVTHLVTDSVLSAKYEGAIGMKIPIVTKEWVESLWKTNLKQFVKPDSKMFDKYRCPVFMHLIITSTNLAKFQKEEIKNLIHSNGGTYMGCLDASKVKILVAPENSPLSNKLKYAMQSNMACLNPNWVYESIKIGYTLPFDEFLIKSTKSSSTPEKCHGNTSFNVSAISAIQYDVQQNYVDESMATIANFSIIEQPTAPGKYSMEIPVLDRLTLANAKMAGTFLDGCNIYLAGFPQFERDKLNKILSIGGANRLDEISDALTHVVIGDGSRASNELNLINSEGLCPYLLTLNWLEESIKLKQPAPEECFFYEQKNHSNKKMSELSTPLSKKNLQMLENLIQPSVTSLETDRKMPSKKRDNALIHQYLEEAVGSSNTVHEFLRPCVSTPDSKTQKVPHSAKKQEDTLNTSMSTVGTRHSANDSSVPLSQNSILGERIFNGFTFAVYGFTKEDDFVAESIIALGGEVVTCSFTGIPDYGVVPTFDAPLKHTGNEIVTNIYIEDCINTGRIIDIQYYHRPMSIEDHSKPLSTCVITMSLYTAGERVFLSTLAVQLGAVFQDTFARKANATKNTLASTHLVCPTSAGNKYNAAVKWKLPAVTAEWLKACAAESRLVDETPYLVENAIAPDRPSSNYMSNEGSGKHNQDNVSLSGIPTFENIITPKRDPLNLQDQPRSTGSPLINKHLNLVPSKTPPSPFHVATPDTPYGQIFKPDPSPETRKGWKKWVDNFPDLYIREPPIEKRRASTPLSELKRQLWQKLKDAGNDAEDSVDLPHMKTVEKHKEITPPTLRDTNTSANPDPVGNDMMAISRKLVFYENTPPRKKEINDQIAQLEEALERIPSASENRYSLANKKDGLDYHTESAPIEKDSQVGTVGWEDPNLGPLDPVKAKSAVAETNVQEDNDLGGISNFEDLDFDTMSKFGSKIEPPPIRKFMLSGMKDRIAYEGVIQNLGGEISTDPNFDMSATHLICTRAARNEKMLGSIAAGKWVLHYSYMRDCEQQGCFLDEEKYEYGNPKSKDVIPEPSGHAECAIAAAAYKWRLKLSQTPNGAFHGMIALLIVLGDKYDQFKRLIEAGGGTVIRAKPPYDIIQSEQKITHCFVNVKQVSQPINWAMFASKGILCFLPQYLSDQLTDDAPHNPQDCVLPEFRNYLSLLPK